MYKFQDITKFRGINYGLWDFRFSRRQLRRLESQGALMMEAVRISETPIFETTRRYIPGDSNLQTMV
jgi:hypothetical protein